MEEVSLGMGFEVPFPVSSLSVPELAGLDATSQVLLQHHARLPTTMLPTKMIITFWNHEPKLNAYLFFLSCLGHGVLSPH